MPQRRAIAAEAGLPAPSSPAPPPPPAPAAASDGDPDRPGPRVGLIVGAVLIAATFLVLATLGVTFLLSRLDPPFGSSTTSLTYEVGDCVVQAGDAAELADCTAPGAFRIVSQVDGRDECADPTQPAIEVPGPPAQFFCLVAAAAGEPDTEPTAAPADDADAETDPDDEADDSADE